MPDVFQANVWTLLQPASTFSFFLTLPEVSSVIDAYVVYYKLSRMFIIKRLELPCMCSCQSSRLQRIPRVSPASPDVFRMTTVNGLACQHFELHR